MNPTFSNDPHPIMPASQPPEDFDLAALIRVIFRQKRLVVGLAVLGGALGLLVSVLGARLYESSVVVVVQGAPGTAAGFRPFLENRKLARDVITDLGLDKPPYNYSATTFFGSVVTVELIRGTQVFEISGQMRDPELVTRVVNRVAEHAVDDVARVFQQAKEDTTARARSSLKAQYDDARARFDAAEKEVNRFRASSQIDLLQKDAEIAVKGHEDLLDVEVKIAAEQARIEAAELELSKRNRTNVLKRTLDTSTLMAEGARLEGSSSEAGRDVRTVQLQDETMNGVFAALDTQLATSRTLLAALTKQRGELAGKRKLDAQNLPQLARLYAAEAELARLETNRDMAKEVTVRLAAAYENARLPMSTESVPMSILNLAIPPDRGLARNTQRNTMLGFLLGLSLGVAVVFIRGAFLESPTR